MARPKSEKHVQVNITLPIEWKTELDRLARIYSVAEDRDVSSLDLIRRAIQEKFQFNGECDE